jgi:hypothetical protein
MTLHYLQVRALRLAARGKRPLIVTDNDWQHQPIAILVLLRELGTLVHMGLMSREDLDDDKQAYNLLPTGHAVLKHYEKSSE